MSKIYSYVVVLYFAVAVCHGLAISYENELPSTRNRREISDECRPVPPMARHHHGQHHGPDDNSRMIPPPMCCDLPQILTVEPDALEKCHDLVFHGMQKPEKRANEESQSENSKDSPPPPPPPGWAPGKKECYFNCVFNASGLLTGDGLLNEDLLNQRLLQTAANNTKWTSTVDPVYKKCVAAAKEANSQSQKSCKQGAAEYLKCMSRELFFNCPSDLWVNSPECNEFKNKLEKCPNLWAPNMHSPYMRRPQHRQHHPHGHHAH